MAAAGRQWRVHDGDSAALAEIAAAQDALLDRDPSDVRSMAVLAMRRDGLIERNRHIPVDLPAVWALLGHPVRARAMARSMSDPIERVKAMVELGLALVESNEERPDPTGDTVRADEVIREAEELASGIESSYEKDDVLASIAHAAARAGDVEHGVALAGGVSSMRRAWVLARVAEAGAQAGDMAGAAAVLRALADLRHQFAAQRGPAARAASQAGDMHGVAVAAARVMSASGHLVSARRHIARTAARAGNLVHGAALALGISDPREQAVALREVAKAGAQAGSVRAAAAVARTISLAEQRVWALAGMAQTVARAGNLDRAAEFAADAAAVRLGVTDRHAQQRALVPAATAMVWAGKLSDAADLARAIVTPEDRSRALAQVAEGSARSADVGQARALTRDAEAAARAVEHADRQAWVLATVIRVAALTGDLDHVRHLADHAWDMAQAAADNSAWQHGILAELVAAEGRGSGHTLARLGIDVDPSARDRVLADAVEVSIRAGECAEAETLARAITDLELRARACTLVARAAAHAGDLDRAHELADDAEAVARTRTIARQRAMALTTASIAMARSGDLDRAGDLAGHAEIAAGTIVDPLWRAHMSAWAAEALARSGSPDRAVALAREAENAADAFPDRQDREWILANVARASAWAGDTGHALDVALTIGNPLNRAPVLSEVIAAMARAGELRHVQDLIAAITDSFAQLDTAAAAAHAAARAGHYRNAATLARDAETLARGCTVDSWRAMTLAAVAEALAQAQEHDHAQRLVRDAAATARAIADGPDRARSLAEVAQATARANDLAHARTLVSEAEADLRQITDDRAWETEELVEAMALAGLADHAETLARSLPPIPRARALAYVAQHVGTADARPLIGQALRLAGWQASIGALASVQPAVLTEVAEAFLTD
jgi:hypothetical protein